MNLTGMDIKKLETLHNLEKEIKYFELDRIEHDLLNTKKLQPLYDIYYRLQQEIKEDLKWQDLML